MHLQITVEDGRLRRNAGSARCMPRQIVLPQPGIIHSEFRHSLRRPALMISGEMVSGAMQGAVIGDAVFSWNAAKL